MASEQPDLFESEAARSLLDRLLSDSRLYRKSADYLELLEFVVRLRNFAPFNAMLLQIQKPGLQYAASGRDWHDRFGREIKVGARPLLILWPFGPVALVYDVLDTVGPTLPKDIAAFLASGGIDFHHMTTYFGLIRAKRIGIVLIDAGDGFAGSIQVVNSGTVNGEMRTEYRMELNRNHDPSVQFATLLHELGHLFLGHLGPDKSLSIIARTGGTHKQNELEAESVAYLACARNGVTSKSEKYLRDYVDGNTTVEEVDLYRVMRAVGQIEALLKLTASSRPAT